MLAGRSVLIVETEYLIALEIRHTLESLGAGKVVIAHSPADAMDFAMNWSDAALAVVELQINRPDIEGLLRSLKHAEIPTIAVTADVRLNGGHSLFPGLPVLIKPVHGDDLASAARSLLGYQT